MSQTDTQPRIFLVDDLPPETLAMVQALYSRSPDTVINHLEQVKVKGPEKFMAQFYVGYGHASIGDCGVTCIFLENVSMLVAKAFQDHPLYSGQESSTRYLDFAVMPQVGPDDSAATRNILSQWMVLYNRVLPKLIEAVRARHPKTEEAKQAVWENATRARAFDIARGLLPVGQATNLSWTTNLRQARDKLMQLKTHPLAEVRHIANAVFTHLKQKYPGSYGAEDMSLEGKYAERARYATRYAMREHFLTPAQVAVSTGLNNLAGLIDGSMVRFDTSLFDLKGLIQTGDMDVLKDRPEGAPLDNRLARYGSFRIAFMLDFASFRDIQRHRNGVCQVPIVTSQFGIHPWYLDQLQDHLGDAEYAGVNAEIGRLLKAADEVELQTTDNEEAARSYLYPMGCLVPCEVTYSLPQTVYVAELRSKADVHATLRPVAQNMGYEVQKLLPGLFVKIDDSPDKWNLERGTKTITKVA